MATSNDELKDFLTDRFNRVDKRFDTLEGRLGHVETTLDGNGKHGIKTRLALLEQKIDPVLEDVDENTKTRQELLTLSRVVKWAGSVAGAALLALFCHILGIIDISIK